MEEKQAGSADRKSQVSKIVSDLFINIDIANGQISELEDRLKSVVRDNEILMNETPEKKIPKQKLVPLAEDLSAINLQIRNICFRLESLTKRIEV